MARFTDIARVDGLVGDGHRNPIGWEPSSSYGVAVSDKSLRDIMYSCVESVDDDASDVPDDVMSIGGWGDLEDD
jgi:hypothetical protein